MKLYDEFQAFGRAIGRDNVAVWFWESPPRALAALAFLPSQSDVDVTRSARFCEALKLPPSGGPYILVTSDYPGKGLVKDPFSFLPTPLKRSYTVSLNNKSADEIMQLLTRLADKITADRLYELDSSTEGHWSVGWPRVFAGIREDLSRLRITVTIKTPLGEIKIG